jgi:hypothetical protein
MGHPVGGDEQLVGHSEAEHPGGLGVDDQLELGWAPDLLRVATYLVGDKKARIGQNIPAPPPAASRANSPVKDEVDAWARKQPDTPSRSEALRRLVEIGLKRKRT